MSRFCVLVCSGIISLSLTASESPASLIQQSVQLQKEGKLAEAAVLMKDLLARPGLPPLVQGLALNELGLAQHSRNQFEEAERTYHRALRMIEQAEGAPPVYLARAHMNLASMYMEWGRYDKAEQERTAIPLGILTDASDISQALGLDAALATVRGELTRAQAAYEQNLAFLRRNGGPDCELQVATTLNNLGAIAFRRQEVGEAERWFALALQSQRQASGNGHPNVVKVLTNVAFAQMRQRNLSGAEATLHEALTISRELFGDVHPITASILDHYAEVLQATGKKKEAKGAKREAAALRQQIPPPLRGGMTVDVSAFQPFTKASDPGSSATAKKQTKQSMPGAISEPRQPN
jgi:tetratricopeptide (TPR) repeat protein